MATQGPPQDRSGDAIQVNGRDVPPEYLEPPASAENTQQVNFDEDASTQGGAPPATNGAQAEDAQTNGAPKEADSKSSKPSKSSSFGKPLRQLTMMTKGPPGGFDNTPLPDAPQGYTIRFIFHYAVNLPPADIHNASSDPFLTATLKAANPKRHKSDPDLIHRTRTIRGTTAPKWEDAWIVANVPPSGFTLKCRMYDEDYPDGNDRLGNVTLKIPYIYDGWRGIPPPGKEFGAKKRMISKRAILLKGALSVVNHNFDMTPRLCMSMEILGKSDPPYAQMCTLGPTTWIKHFSPMIGRLTGTKVNADEEAPPNGASSSIHQEQNHNNEKRTQKYE